MCLMFRAKLNRDTWIYQRSITLEHVDANWRFAGKAGICRGFVADVRHAYWQCIYVSEDGLELRGPDSSRGPAARVVALWCTTVWRGD